MPRPWSAGAFLGIVLAAGFDLTEGSAQELSGLGVDADGAVLLAEDAAGVLAADLDGDGIDEWAALLPGGILIRPGGGGEPFVASSSGARAFAARETIAGGAWDLILALDGAIVSLDISTGDGTLLAGIDAAAVAAGDLDGDGVRDDILAAAGAAGIVLLGDGIEPDLGVADAVAAHLVAGDFLGRGYDQAAISLAAGGLQILDLVAEDTFVMDAPQLGLLGALDIDGDGAEEILSYLPDAGLVAFDAATGDTRLLEVDPDAITPAGVFLQIDLTGPSTPATFVRGNVNADADVDISDAVAILGDLFLGAPARETCRKALDSNDSGEIDISDGVFILTFLFGGGRPIPPPYPEPGMDPTPDLLDCVR